MARVAKNISVKVVEVDPVDDASTAPIRPFNRSLPWLLMKAREAVMQRFRPHLKQHEITEQQWRILRVLAEERNVDMLALATRCSIQPPSLSRTIRLLVSRGLVRRCSHGIDQRRILVDLTPKGRQLFRAMSEESTLIYARLESDIGEAKLQQIYGILDEVIIIAAPRGGSELIEPEE